MRIESLKTSVLSGCTLAAVLAVSGCVVSEKIGVDQSGAPVYERMNIVYGVEGPTETTAASASRRDAIQDDVEQAGFEPRSWSKAHLKIEYPHAEAPEQFGRATLILSGTSSNGAETAHVEADGWRTGLQRLVFRRAADVDGGEQADVISQTSGADKNVAEADTEETGEVVRILDIPKLELDLLLIDLAGSGFFDDQHRPASPTRLDVRINRGRVAKQWTPEPRLDDLMETIARYGKSGG